MGVGIIFDLENQDNLGAYEYTCKNCKKVGYAKTDRKKYCHDTCRYEYNALIKEVHNIFKGCGKSKLQAILLFKSLLFLSSFSITGIIFFKILFLYQQFLNYHSQLAPWQN